MMDFGSMVCTPKSPSCASCPLAPVCLARINNTQHLRPVKKPKKKAVNRFLLFKVQLQQGKIRMVQQQKGSIWENLFLFPFEEFSSEAAFLTGISQESRVINDRSIHVLSHQRLHYAVVLSHDPLPADHGFWFSRDELYDVPTPILVPRILTRVENQLAPLF
jgi:A/G-specific adenine glycosylase